VVNTYNLEVRGTGTYFVGAGGVWVHNTGVSCKKLLGKLTARITDPRLPLDSHGRRNLYRILTEPDFLSVSRQERRAIMTELQNVTMREALAKEPFDWSRVHGYSEMKQFRQSSFAEDIRDLRRLEIHHTPGREWVETILEMRTPGRRFASRPKDPILDGHGMLTGSGPGPIPGFALPLDIHNAAGGQSLHERLNVRLPRTEIQRLKNEGDPLALKRAMEAAIKGAFDDMKLMHPGSDVDFESMKRVTLNYLATL
jgi:hypothetical protein